MPEGDTLWNHAAHLRPALVGHAVTDLRVHRNRKRGPRPGVKVEGVEAAGKHLLITFDDGVILHTHLQMTGEWHLYRAGQRWRNERGAMRALVATKDHVAVCFAAPTVALYHPAEAGPRPWDRIGPDLCHAEPDFDSIAANLAATGQARQIADVLLDQTMAAGIGNVYKSETLWFCRQSPFAELGAIENQKRRTLYQRASGLLHQNLGRSRRQTFRNGLAVYGRGRRDCPRCHSIIRRIEHGDDLVRVSYWCPRCQPGP
ncbi:MAG: hypothetical protein GXP35_15565 [Actinobacteria bacterium]|nr:hypothetical protein [Actinomycetota bacterium]